MKTRQKEREAREYGAALSMTLKQLDETTKQTEELKQQLAAQSATFTEARRDIADYFVERRSTKKCIICNTLRAFLIEPCYHIEMCPGCFCAGVHRHQMKPECPVCKVPVTNFIAPTRTRLPWWLFLDQE